MTLLEVWATYAFLGMLVYCALFIWALRNKQFTGFDRARHIPLDAAEPIEPENRRASRLDRYTGRGIALLTLALFGYTLWVALR
ncbi:MAG: hypothetical protein IT210_20050 [Armatimonadetes bacterium]|nr:hypothetical protein [Armatimonadota bacterium]